MDKQLKDKAIKIHNKEYVQVADRILFFNEHYDGGITTELLSDPAHETIVIKATVSYTDENGDHTYTGHAQEVVGNGNINKTSALENAETSAVGRALAMMGIGVIESVASVDEITKANNREF